MDSPPKIVRRAARLSGRRTVSLDSPVIPSPGISRGTPISPDTAESTSKLCPSSSSNPLMGIDWSESLLDAVQELNPLPPASSQPPRVIRRPSRLLGRRVQTLEPTSELQEQQLAGDVPCWRPCTEDTSRLPPRRPSTTDVLSALGPLQVKPDQAFSIQAFHSQSESDVMRTLIPVPEESPSSEFRRPCPQPSFGRRRSGPATLPPLRSRDEGAKPMENALCINSDKTSHCETQSCSVSSISHVSDNLSISAKGTRKPSVPYPKQHPEVPSQNFHPALNTRCPRGYLNDLNGATSHRRLIGVKGIVHDTSILQEAQKGSLPALGRLFIAFYGSLPNAFTEFNFSRTGHITWREWIAGLRKTGLRIQTKTWRTRCGCRLSDVWFRLLACEHDDFIIREDFISKCSEDAAVHDTGSVTCASAPRVETHEVQRRKLWQPLEDKFKNEEDDFDKLVEAESSKSRSKPVRQKAARMIQKRWRKKRDAAAKEKAKVDAATVKIQKQWRKKKGISTESTVVNQPSRRSSAVGNHNGLYSIPRFRPDEENDLVKFGVDFSDESEVSDSDDESLFGNLSRIFNRYTESKNKKTKSKNQNQKIQRRAMNFADFWRFCQDYDLDENDDSDSNHSEWLSTFSTCESLERDFLHGSGDYNVGEGLGLDFFKMCVYMGLRKLNSE